jgi:hypothetical protein
VTTPVDRFGPIPWEPSRRGSSAARERDHDRMINWLRSEMDKIYDLEIDDYQRVQKRFADPARIEAYWKTICLNQARHGNIGPLREFIRKRDPKLAEFINLPKRKKGVRFPKDKSSDKVDLAVADVGRIRSLWKKHFGRLKRPKNDPLAAEQIAADWWDVEVEDVIERIRKKPAKR